MLYALAASFMPVSGSVATLFVIGASAGVSPPSSRPPASPFMPPPPLTRTQELVLPTLAGHLFDSSGPQSFPIFILCCAVANMCLFEPLLFYGRRALQLTAPGGGGEGVAGSDSESEGRRGGSFMPMDEVRAGQQITC